MGEIMTQQKEYNQCSRSIPCNECQSNADCKAWVDFVQTHNEIKRYAHFDKRVSLQFPGIRRYVMNPLNIEKHAFYPFIHFVKKYSRYGKRATIKSRELYYCSHLDRCVYQRYSFLLNQYYNKWASQNSIDHVAIAYRNNLHKNNIHFAHDAFSIIQEMKNCFIMVGDFTNFFDNLNHKYLKKMLCKVLDYEILPNDYYNIFKSITKFASWDWKDLVLASGNSISEYAIRTKVNKKPIIITKKQFEINKKMIHKNDSQKGIPQGSPISAVLANIYMIDFDTKINNYVSERKGIYYRYSDDIIIIIPYSNSNDINIYKEQIMSQIDDMHGLIDLQEEKTHFYMYHDGLTLDENGNPSSIDYLGFILTGKDIKVRPRAITKYYYRMRRKAHTIGRNNWKSKTGKRISAKNLYELYSHNPNRQTFIDYIKRADHIMTLNDSESSALIKRHRHKIHQAINKSLPSQDNDSK